MKRERTDETRRERKTLSREELDRRLQSAAEVTDRLTDVQTIPVIEETITVDKELVETGTVEVRKRVTATDEVFETPIMKDVVDIRRVAVDELLDEPMQPRTEGRTLVLPVMEEVVVVQKKILLKEVLYVTTKQIEEIDRQVVNLRRETVDVERKPARPRKPKP